MDMGKTYRIERGPPALGWQAYSDMVEAGWQELLSSNEGATEREIQSFLELHPCLVPGGQSMSGPSGHPAYPAALISQPRLPGFGQRLPDFLWIAKDSMSIYAVLIEIESPTKKWFRADGVSSADFTQAHNQLAEWKAWFSSPTNQAQFKEAYCQPIGTPWKTLVPQYVLIYGRRTEFDGREHLSAKRSFLQREHEYHMTFDRLRPNKNQDQYMTVKFNGSKYRAIDMPATLQLGPMLAKDRLLIEQKEDVVDRTPYLSEDRKAFLKLRLPYWDTWARSGEAGIKNMGDFE